MRSNSAYDLGHARRCMLADRLRRADAGDDVLALGVGQVLAVEHLLAGVGVARERDARARVVAHVAEDHGHDVDGRAQVVGDLVVLAVVVRALAEPRREDGLDREVELLHRIARELAAGRVADDRQELPDQLLERRGVELRVLRDAAARLRGVQRLVELLAGDVHDDPAEHLDEAPVRVPAEALVAGQRDQAVQRLLVEAQVEDRVHHPRHRELGARADATRAAGWRDCRSPCPSRCSTSLTAAEHVVPQTVGQLLARGEVVVARLGRDREAGRHRQAGVGHLGEARALATEQVAHRRVALGMARAERVDVALGRAVLALGGHRWSLCHQEPRT